MAKQLTSDEQQILASAHIHVIPKDDATRKICAGLSSRRLMRMQVFAKGGSLMPGYIRTDRGERALVKSGWALE